MRPGRPLLALLSLVSAGSSILKLSIEMFLATALKGSFADRLLALKFSACRAIEFGISCCSRSELMTSLEYYISLLNSSRFLPKMRKMGFFACFACFMSLSMTSRSLTVEPMIEPGPLPLRTLPAFMRACFMSLSCRDGLHFTPVDGVIPAL